MDKNKGSQQSNKDLTQGINILQNINTTPSKATDQAASISLPRLSFSSVIKVNNR